MMNTPSRYVLDFRLLQCYLFLQNAWTGLDGSATTREFLLMALADLDAILIRATFTKDTDEAR